MGVASTSDGVQFLAMYEVEDFEVHFQTDAGWDYIVPHSNEQSGDVGVTLRGGKRFNIGDFNYIAVGAHVYKPFFNQTEGVNGPVNFMVGPYVALQRSFRGSHLMLTAWVLPVSYASMAEDLVPGTRDFERVNSVGWFKDGGIGITYLF